MNEMKEAAKEALRVCLVAVIPVLIDSLNAGSINFRAVGIIAMIALLRLVDKYLHESGKVLGDANMTKGLTRF